MNESRASLDDLALFLVVAECATLTEAAARLSLPLPTLSRRMKVLEERLGRALFLRGSAGYALSADGRSLADAITGLRDLTAALHRWQNRDRRKSAVRITAGSWTSLHLARRLVARDEDIWVPEFLPSNAVLDLARRAADIGIRNAPPDQPWLARQRLPAVRFAIYGVPRAAERYVALPPGPRLPASQSWLHRAHGARIVTTASDPRLCLDLALAGHGRMVLPCFIGDETAGLERMGAPIDELTHDAWLVSHQDTRHRPDIRAAITAVRAALAGDAPRTI